ncbi:MAG: hypothetical protein J5713_04530 [Clostridia bacterium]|nr:hypothetical protein [Clostridia bacterium]
MKFRMNFGLTKTIIIAVVIVFALALVGLDVAMLAGAKGIATSLPAVAAVSLAASVIIAVAACLVLFGSFYKFEKDRLVIMLGIFRDVIPYENVTEIRQDGSTRELYIVAKGVRIQDGENVIKFNVDKKKTDDLIEAFKKSMPEMIIEVFTPVDNKPKH